MARHNSAQSDNDVDRTASANTVVGLAVALALGTPPTLTCGGEAYPLVGAVRGSALVSARAWTWLVPMNTRLTAVRRW
jgi:hypothetical protein